MSFYVARKSIRKLPGDIIQHVPMPTPKLIRGYRSRAQIGKLCKKLGFSSILVVTDQTISSLGFQDRILEALEKEGIRYALFDQIASEPTAETESLGRDAALKSGAECIIALGGGSVLDTSKIIAAATKFPKIPVEALLLKFLAVPGGTLPLITIPTTAGTGAEATVGAVTTNTKTQTKTSTVIVGLNVPTVILDSELTLHAPKKITVSCGIDALSHGIEGCLADVRSSRADQTKSLTCVKLVFDNLPKLIDNPEDIAAREAMSLAAFYGGNAINKQLAGYVHAFAHSIGAKYHIPHGDAIARCIVPVIRANKDLSRKRLAVMARFCGFATPEDTIEDAAENFLKQLSELIRKCDFTFSSGLIPKEDFSELTEMIDKDSINYSAPKTFTDKEIHELLEEISKGNHMRTENAISDQERKIQNIVETQRRFFRTNKTLPVDWRILQLKRLKAAVIRHEAELEEALHEDLGRTRTEAYLTDIGPIIVEINEMIRGLKKWARPETHFSGLMCFPSITTKVYKMPYGVTLIISPFNFPLLLSFGVLAASISGGNTAVIKTSSKSPACTKVIKKLVAEIFPPEYITVVDGGHDVADICLAQRFDKIFYTGSPAVGKHVMAEAAKNLTPVALELGGETGNWCIVRKDADIRDAARKIAFFKLCNAGQICININQIAVAEEIADDFNRELINAFIRQIGEHPQENPEYPKLITDAAYEKCANLAKAYQDRIIFGGGGNREIGRFAPTIIYPVKKDEEIVQHELFCPLLPVVPFKDAEIDALMETIADREHPLALYVFTKNMRWAKKVMCTQQFGGGCINEVCLHMMVKGVPFNGTGHSGMGAYHGIWGFREFTHPATVLKGQTRFNLPLREHPYSGKIGERKLSLLRKFER